MFKRLCFVFAIFKALAASLVMAQQIDYADQTCSFDFRADTKSEAILKIGAQCEVSILLQGALSSEPGEFVLSGDYSVLGALREVFTEEKFEIELASESVIVLRPLAEASPTAAELIRTMPARPKQKLVIKEAPPPITESEKQLGPIEVTGTRFQNASYIASKRNARLIRDSLYQDDIGLQPDFNMVDAARRVSGVAAYRDEEEGISIGLRGLSPDYVNVTLDGAAIATSPATAARRDFVEALPPSLFGAIEVTKSRNAETNGATIGGQVNFASRSAFDADQEFFSINGSVGRFAGDRFDLADNGPAFRLNGVLSNKFGSRDEFGYVVAGSFFSRDQDEERALIFYDDSYAIPTTGIWNGIESPFERLGGYGKIEYRAGETAQFDLAAYRILQDEAFTRASNIIVGSNPLPRATRSMGGRVELAEGSLQILESSDSKNQGGILGKGSLKIGDSWQLSFRSSFSEAVFEEGDNDRSDIDFKYAGLPNELAYDFSFVDQNQTPLVRFVAPTRPTDLNNYTLNSIKRDLKKNEDRSSDIEGRARYEVLDTGISLNTGMRYEGSKHSFNANSRVLSYTGETPLLLSEFGRFSSSYTPPNGPLRSPIIDSSRIVGFARSNPRLFTQISDTSGTAFREFEVAEDVLGSYLSMQYQSDRADFNLGIRIEQTSVNTQLVEDIGGILQIFNSKNKYTNALPSVGGTYRAGKAFVFRAAYSKALARPSYSDLSPGPRVESTTQSVLHLDGNPELTPRISDNFDLSLEYYFDAGRSLASIGVFHKSIDDEVFKARILNRNTDSSAWHIPQNVGQSRYTGVEFNLIKDRLDFAPGPFRNFGASANLTLVDANARLLTDANRSRSAFFPTEQPEILANASLFYQAGPFDARLSYSLTGEYANSISEISPDADDYVSSFETLDAQARFRLTDSLTLILDGRNLLDEKSIKRSGPNKSRVEDYSAFGSAYFIGLTYTP